MSGLRTMRSALAAALVLVAVLPAAPGSADVKRVRDPDPYESYFLGARGATFANGAKAVRVRADHRALMWSAVDVVRVTMLVGRMQRRYAPPVATQYTAVWERGRGVRLERQSPGQELPDRVACRGLRMRHTEAPARVITTVPVRCLKVPAASRPGLAAGGGDDIRFSYLVHDSGGNVTETVPGTSGQGAYPSDFTRWIDRG